MRSSNSLLREYVSTLSYKELLFLKTRFSQRVGGDLGEAVNFVSKNEEIDKWFQGIKDYVDEIHNDMNCNFIVINEDDIDKINSKIDAIKYFTNDENNQRIMDKEYNAWAITNYFYYYVLELSYYDC